MKQLLQDLRAGQVRLEEVPIPSSPPGMALVRTAASLVSAGTERTLAEFAGKSLLGKAAARPDLLRQVLNKARREGLANAIQAAFSRLEKPMPMGYSSAGTIVELGAGMQGYRVGQRVACAGGGYAVHAEYALVPQNLLAPLPDSVDFESAAFSTLGAIALHGYRLAEVQVGARVAVIGLGLLGQLAADVARAAGCKVLGIDLDMGRAASAQARGTHAVLRDAAVEEADAFTDEEGFDAVLICADTESNDPVELAGEIARERAKVVVVGAVGMDAPRRSYYAKELSLVVSRSYGPGRYDPGYEEAGLDYPIGYVRWTEGRNLAAFVDLLAQNAVNTTSLISHRFPIDESPKAYDLIQGNEEFLGVLITYPGEDEWPLDKQVEFAKPRPQLEGQRVRLGVIGAGNFARATMLPVLKRNKQIELVAIASSSGLAASDLAKRYRFQRAASDAEDVLGADDVDAVAILTRHGLHADLSLQALQAGKHVFCEKPLALHEEELAALEEQLSKDERHLLTVGFNRRFAPLAQELRTFLEGRNEPLAAHYRVNAGYLPPDHWLHDPAQGGGRLLGEACHFIDFLTFLVGQPPNAVSGKLMADGGRYQGDNFVLNFSYPDGSIATLTYLANGDSAVSKERIEVFAGGQVALLDDFQELETVADGKRSKIRGKQDKGHAALWGAFAAALLEDGELPISCEQLFAVTRAAFAAQKALRKGESVEI